MKFLAFNHRILALVLMYNSSSIAMNNDSKHLIYEISEYDVDCPEFDEHIAQLANTQGRMFPLGPLLAFEISCLQSYRPHTRQYVKRDTARPSVLNERQKMAMQTLERIRFRHPDQLPKVHYGYVAQKFGVVIETVKIWERVHLAEKTERNSLEHEQSNNNNHNSHPSSTSTDASIGTNS